MKNNFDNITRKNIHILKAILGSRNYTAYYILWVRFLRLLLSPLDFVLQILEKLFLGKSTKSNPKMIFVVGPHRSGTTFISQAIADSLPFYALGNFNSIFFRSKYFIHKLFRRYHRSSVQGKYKNFYGVSAGLFGMGDAHEVWDQWYGDDHSTVPEILTEEQTEDLQTYFSYLSAAVGKPIIIKSGRNSMFIGKLSSCFPDALFVVVNRDMEYIVQSTIKANEYFFGEQIAMWGLRPDFSFNPDNYDSFLEAVCQQCLQVQARIEEQLSLVPKDRCIKIPYSDFCADPKKYIAKVHNYVTGQMSIDVNPPPDLPKTFIKSRGAGDTKLLTEISDMLRRITSIESK